MLAADDADIADQDWFYLQVLIDIRAIRQIRVIRGHSVGTRISLIGIGITWQHISIRAIRQIRVIRGHHWYGSLHQTTNTLSQFLLVPVLIFRFQPTHLRHEF